MHCPEVTKEQIQAVEEHNLIKLPDRFKNWLLDKNKKLPSEPSVQYYDPVKQYMCSTCVGEFLSFRNEIEFDYVTWKEHKKNDYEFSLSLFPKGFIPFAIDPGGWSFCFDCRINKEDPPVILWIGDNLPETAVTPVAENFTAFLKLIGAE